MDLQTSLAALRLARWLMGEKVYTVYRGTAPEGEPTMKGDLRLVLDALATLAAAKEV